MNLIKKVTNQKLLCIALMLVVPLQVQAIQ